MNEIEKQMLENQRVIMSGLTTICDSIGVFSSLNDEIKKTTSLLSPKQQDQECSDGLPKPKKCDCCGLIGCEKMNNTKEKEFALSSGG